MLHGISTTKSAWAFIGRARQGGGRILPQGRTVVAVHTYPSATLQYPSTFYYNHSHTNTVSTTTDSYTSTSYSSFDPFSKAKKDSAEVKIGAWGTPIALKNQTEKSSAISIYRQLRLRPHWFTASPGALVRIVSGSECFVVCYKKPAGLKTNDMFSCLLSALTVKSQLELIKE